MRWCWWWLWCLPALAAPEPLGDHFIWLPTPAPDVSCHVAFRKLLELKVAPARAELAIFADSAYQLWVNGRLVERGPGRCDPAAPRYDRVALEHLLHRGPNQLAVLVRPAGPGSGQRRAHAPGLAARLTRWDDDGRASVEYTDRSWLAAPWPSRLPVPACFGWQPDAIDGARESDEWLGVFFDERAWQPAASVDGRFWGPLLPRYLPRLRETTVVSADLLRGPARGRLRAALPLTLTPQTPALIDLGQTVLGYEQFDLTAAAGTVLEVRHGLGLARGELEGGEGATRYVAREGRQVFTTSDSVGCRYLRLSVDRGTLVLGNLKVSDRRYPFDLVGSFRCSDPRLDDLWQRSVDTIALCSEDAYLDSAGRRCQSLPEAVLCAWPVTRVAFAVTEGDAPPVTRWGDPRLLVQALRQMADGQRLDGRLRVTAPTDLTEPDEVTAASACLWVRGVRQAYEAVGDRALLTELWPALRRQMQWLADHRDGQPATVAAWRDAALLAALVDDADAMAEWAGLATELATALDRRLAEQPLTAGLAAAALATDTVPAGQRARVLDWLVAHLAELTTPLAVGSTLEPLFRADRDQVALDLLRRRWAPSLARTDTEVLGASFDGGPLAHAQGAVAAWPLSAWVLGVQPSGPLADRRVTLEPHLGDLTRAEGRVVTPHGLVGVSWQRTQGQLRFRVELPEGVRASVLVKGDAQRVDLDGQRLDRARVGQAGPRLRLELEPGTHTGAVAG